MAHPDWVYYHALYNVLTHAAAYVATFALLITAGIVLSTSQNVSHRWYLGSVIGLAGFAAVYFLLRWYVFSTIVNETLGGAVAKTVWVGPGWLATIGIVLTLLVVASDFVLLRNELAAAAHRDR